jgi:tungstate transport system substrate-binding protein
LVLASTTSTEDSGLFDRLLPAFAAAAPDYDVRLVAVGSGQALRLGERGDADVLLVHSPAEEARFMAAGFGEERRPVMHNEFVIVGPGADPAGARGRDPAGALRAIAEAGSPFVSRGDDSGTHRKEQALWRAAGVSPEREPWYADVGQGMGETLAVAAERGAYTLTDVATFLFLEQLGGLRVLVEGDSALRNPYSVIVATRARNRAGARAFARWITAPAAQQLIGAHGRAEFGRPLFIPVNDSTGGQPPARQTSSARAGTAR